MIQSTTRMFALFVLLLGLAVGGVGAATEGPNDFNVQTRAWDQALDRMSARVDTGRTGSIEEKNLRQKLQAISEAAGAEQHNAGAQAKQVKVLLEALGPPPTENEKSEDETVRKRRAELNRALAAAEGRAKRAGLVIAKAEQVVAKINSRSRERLRETLLERTVTPLSPRTWSVALPEAGQLLEVSFVETPRRWWARVQTDPVEQAAVKRNLVVAVLAAIGGWLFGRWLRARLGRVQGIEKPSYGRRILAGLVEGGGRTLGPVIFVLLTGTAVLESGVLDGPMDSLLSASMRSLVLFLLGYALINAALTSRRAEWRLLKFGDEASGLLGSRLKMLLAAFLVFDGVHRAVSWAKPSAELASISALGFTLALTPLMLSLLSGRIWGHVLRRTDREPQPRHSRMQRLRVILPFGLALLPVAAMLGYSGLASFLLTAVVMTGLALAALGMVRAAGRESLAVSLDVHHPMGRVLRDLFALDKESGTRTLFWLRVLLDLGLVVVAGFALPPIWGLGADDTLASAERLLRGIQVGSYTLSLLDIFIALFIFAMILILTRSVQRGLDRHVLPNLSRDKGVRDALKTSVGYIGVVIASLVGISALGLDLTNLALIAGALSVGLGFGLQNVVNNFVSGLILLAERPIKPGDWVVIGSHEGKVKQVNVRSTEIETFQRASVIMPNADLISNPVVNWTHKNILGRVEVAVGVAYGTNPRLVETILLDVARAHPNVIVSPEPYVLFTEFGDSSLNFELRAYLSDVENRLMTSSDIRFAIHDALKEHNVEIPFPQRVLHMAHDKPKNAQDAPQGNDR